MIFVLGGGLLLALVWIGRRPGNAPIFSRWLRVLAGLALAVGAVAEAARGAWPVSALLVLASLAIWRPSTSFRSRRQPASGMSEDEARSILGVGKNAQSEEIDAAYRRLMRRVHPDAGGAEGLAALLNEARRRLRP